MHFSPKFPSNADPKIWWLAFALLVTFADACFAEQGGRSRSSPANLLHEGNVYVSRPYGGSKDLAIFCYPGEPVSYLTLFKSIYVEFKLVPEHYRLFEGHDEASVRSRFESHAASWVPLLPWKQTTIAFPAFQPHCVGLVSEDDYRLELVVRQANYWRLLQFGASVALFFGVPSLCRNVLVFYSCGVTLGVLASLLVVVFVVSRLLPRCAAGYAVVCFGWSLVLYLLQLLWSNVYHVLADYTNILAGYVALTALLSFAVCYRLGPPTNPRTLNLFQWSLQLAALSGVFTSSEIREATGAVVIALLVAYNMSSSWTAKFRTWWRTLVYRPKVTLLSEEEYVKQGDVETRKALEALREFCRSPGCKPWNVVTRLRNPVRFAEFVEGKSHLADEEVLQYELDSSHRAPSDADGLLTEDDSDDNEQPSFTELAG